MVSGPAGMRCFDCASLRKTALYQIPPARLALAAVAGLATGLVGAFLMTALGWFVFFVGPMYGGIVAEAVLRTAGRKRGRILEIIGVGSIVIGALVVCLPMLGMFRAPGLGFSLLGLLWPLVGFALAISACWGRLKYL